MYSKLFKTKAAKKIRFLMNSHLEGGGRRRLNGCATTEKKCNVRKKFLWPLSREGGGAKGFSGQATKKRFSFCGFPKVLSVILKVFIYSNRIMSIWVVPDTYLAGYRISG